MPKLTFLSIQRFTSKACLWGALGIASSISINPLLAQSGSKPDSSSSTDSANVVKPLSYYKARTVSMFFAGLKNSVALWSKQIRSADLMMNNLEFQKKFSNANLHLSGIATDRPAYLVMGHASSKSLFNTKAPAAEQNSNAMGLLSSIFLNGKMAMAVELPIDNHHNFRSFLKEIIADDKYKPALQKDGQGDYKLTEFLLLREGKSKAWIFAGPSDYDPEKLIAAIDQQKVDPIGESKDYWLKVVNHIANNRELLTSLDSDYAKFSKGIFGTAVPEKKMPGEVNGDTLVDNYSSVMEQSGKVLSHVMNFYFEILRETGRFYPSPSTGLIQLKNNKDSFRLQINGYSTVKNLPIAQDYVKARRKTLESAKAAGQVELPLNNKGDKKYIQFSMPLGFGDVSKLIDKHDHGQLFLLRDLRNVAVALTDFLTGTDTKFGFWNQVKHDFNLYLYRVPKFDQVKQPTQYKFMMMLGLNTPNNHRALAERIFKTWAGEEPQIKQLAKGLWEFKLREDYSIFLGAGDHGLYIGNEKEKVAYMVESAPVPGSLRNNKLVSNMNIPKQIDFPIIIAVDWNELRETLFEGNIMKNSKSMMPNIDKIQFFHVPVESSHTNIVEDYYEMSVTFK